MNAVLFTYKILLLSGLLCLLSYPLFGGRESEYSDRYPKFSVIIPYHSSIYFAGIWMDKYVVAERNKQGDWHIYSQKGNRYFKQLDSMINNRIQSLSDPRYPENLNYGLDVKDDSIINKFIFPLPSYNALCRWRFFPNSFNHLEANIGSSVKIENDLWFSIDFYAGEGCTGIGGLGLFDFTKKKFGVIRDKLLSSCSGGLIVNHGDTIFVATNISSEYGTYGDKGLVLVNLRDGNATCIPSMTNPLDGDYFIAMKIIDDVLWISSDRSIISWSLIDNTWKSYRLECVVTNKRCNIYRRPKLYSDFSNGGLPMRIDYDSTVTISYLNKTDILLCESPENELAEIQTRKGIYGWISKKEYQLLSKMSKENRSMRYPDAILYSDTTLKYPIHSFRASSFSVCGQSEDAVNLCVNGAWIKMDDVDPIITEYSYIDTAPLQWRSILESQTDIKQQAFKTLEMEQSEIINETPILNTTLTIYDTLDLYDSYERILDARWLPSNNFDKNQSPQGIKLNDKTELWIKNGKLDYNGKTISIGDTLNAVDGDAIFTYKILDYKTVNNDKNRLKELTIQYIVVMTPKRERW